MILLGSLISISLSEMCCKCSTVEEEIPEIEISIIPYMHSLLGTINPCFFRFMIIRQRSVVLEHCKSSSQLEN